MHTLHGMANAFNKGTELIHCTNCGHLTNRHHDAGWGKWECDQCGKICIA